MKRLIAVTAALLLGLLIVLSVPGCGTGGANTDGATTTASGARGGLVTTSSESGSASTEASSSPTSDAAASSTDTTATTAGAGDSGGSDKVFLPHELLSADEASAISTFAVTLDAGSLYKDEESGTISERYVYDLSGTTINALVEVHQDSFRTGEGSVKDTFAMEKNLGKNEITMLKDFGDEAFTHGQGQLHLLYRGYYIVVAFDADPYSTDQNAPLNIKLGTQILENLKTKLG